MFGVSLAHRLSSNLFHKCVEMEDNVIRKEIDTKYVLSIAIPAYGYPKALKKNISHLLKIKRNDVQFVVVDNDDTGTQIRDEMMKIKDPRFFYYQNKKNIGRTCNIVRAVEKSAASHVLLVSCDDEVNNAAIDAIIDIIKRNPNCAVIYGQIIDSVGSAVRRIKVSFRAKKGIDALMEIGHMGSLYPFVINKEYLDFKALYEADEVYMQTRLAIEGSLQGDAYFLNKTIARVKAYDNYSGDASKISESLIVLNYDFSTWSIGETYADPKSRAEQLKGYFRIVEKHGLAPSDYWRYVECLIGSYIPDVIGYAALCHDPIQLEGKSVGKKMTYKEALNCFYNELHDFFSVEKDSYHYDFIPMLNKRIDKEWVNFKVAEKILHAIETNEKTYIYYTGIEVGRLIEKLNMMGVSVAGCIHYDGGDEIKGVKACPISEIDEHSIILVSHKTRIRNMVMKPIDKIRRDLSKQNLKNVYVLREMETYLLSVWCSRPENADKYDFYGR